MPRDEKPTKEDRALTTADQRSFEAVAEVTRAMKRRRAACARLARRRPLPPLRPGEEEWDGKEIL